MSFIWLVALPWYVAVQMRNPEFFRVFILEHNLARFSANVYHHPQPFWFYLPVFLLALMPWALALIVTMWERVRVIWAERRQAFLERGRSWTLFLLIWMLVPVLFFSASQSKAAGIYFAGGSGGSAAGELSFIPGDWERKRRSPGASDDKEISPRPSGVAHGAMCGALIFVCRFGSVRSRRLIVWRGERSQNIH